MFGFLDLKFRIFCCLLFWFFGYTGLDRSTSARPVRVVLSPVKVKASSVLERKTSKQTDNVYS